MEIIERLCKKIGVMVILAAFGMLMAFPVKWTWNTTMPDLFSLPTIDWLQAWCLFLLSNFLLKSLLFESKKHES